MWRSRSFEGLASACQDNGCALLGGETAEMPGFYADGEYDIAGFIVGAVDRQRIIDGKSIVPGDVLIGLPSNGLHTNGYSLASKVAFEELKLKVDSHVPDLGETVGDAFLRPHRSYLAVLKPLLGRGLIKGMAHITGGGITDNLPRVLPPGAAARVNRTAWRVPAIFRWIGESGRVPEFDLRRALNMGIGMILVVAAKDADAVRKSLLEAGEANSVVIGDIVSGDERSELRVDSGSGIQGIMKRRQALHTLASAAAALPLLRVPLEADELTADQAFVLRDIAATVLPSAIGRKGQDEAVDNFLRWIRDYKEGVPLSHGYGEPRLVKIRAVTGAGLRETDRRIAGRGKGEGRPLRRAADRRSPGAPGRGLQGRRCSEPPWPARRQACCRRFDGALLPQQRRQRSLLQRAHRAQHVSRHSHDDGAPATAEWRARAVALARTMPIHESDVCVIGGGITAAMLIERLAELKPGLRITVIEAGRSIFDRENRGTYHRRALEYGEHPWHDDYIEDQQAKGMISMTMAVGGQALHWGGACNRFSEEDLRLKSMYGLAG